MKNPLNKRIPKELKRDFGKYFVIFAFMIMLIGLVSGFLVASNSMMVSFDQGLEDYKVEHGHFTLDKKPAAELLLRIEDAADIELTELCYVNLLDDKGKKFRVYEKRQMVNLECLMEGAMPAHKDEIAIDRLFAENNHLWVGDSVCLNDEKLVISGIVALPDYSSLFENNTDMMFNATNFTVAIMNEEGFKSLGEEHKAYNYAWRYRDDIDRTNDKLNQDLSDNVLEALKDVITDYDERIADEAIADGKLIFLSELLEQIDANMVETGMSVAMFDSEEGRKELLQQIEGILEGEEINLAEEFDTDEEITLTVADVERAMNASDKDIEMARENVDTVENRIILITDYVPQYQNQGINFAREDIGGDSAMFLVFGYLVTLILAFVFGVTISNTIIAEAGVIGTLRASGYTKGELVRHYLVLPVSVTLVAAIIGNILGYTWLKQTMASLYYHSYSLATYETLWNSEAFIKTTVIPVLLMFIVNLVTLLRKLKLAPIRFLRRDLSKKGKKKAFRLNTKIPFLHRFRIRVIFQNISNYLTLFFGIFLGGAVTIFGFMFAPMLVDYKDLILEQRICDYQYVVMDSDVETENEQAEKYSMTSLKITYKDYVEDEVSVCGIEENSKYIHKTLPEEGVLVSSAFQKKFGLNIGDAIELCDTYTEKVYTFEITDFYECDAGFYIFMPRGDFNKKFGKSADYFTGYFSNEKLTDLDDDEIATVIQVSDLTKTSDQLLDSMGGFMDMIMYFGMVLFLLLMYLLSKQIIEKNAHSISMTKILGFYNGEIGGIYVVATTIVVVISLLVTCPLTEVFLRFVFENYLYKMLAGYFPYIISPDCYIKMIAMGIGCYGVVAFFQMRKIRKIPKVDALKNVE